MAYDPNNIFAKILRGEIPCTKVLETEHSLAFRDINPQRPVHVLVIPKGAYVTWDDFATNATPAEQADFVQAVGAVAYDLVKRSLDQSVGLGCSAVLADDCQHC